MRHRTEACCGAVYRQDISCGVHPHGGPNRSERLLIQRWQLPHVPQCHPGQYSAGRECQSRYDASHAVRRVHETASGVSPIRATARLRVPTLAATLFASAFLLFVCQPMVGKMVLPHLGGAAAVWTTCVLFFQAMLLAGYVYAHLLGRASDVRKQILTHALVLLLPLAFLPMVFRGDSSGSSSQHPSLWLMLRLLTSAGVPLFVVSATAPLLQNWLSRTKDMAARDPYFLYAASNTGSLLALIAYPSLLEPRVGVVSQNRLWFGGYLGLLVLIGLVSVLVWRHSEKQQTQKPVEPVRPIQVRTRLYWIAAAFLPSALLLAVTNHITANPVSLPFLSIVPLAMYLLS